MAEVVLPTHHERKGSKIKEKAELEREARQNKSEVQKKKIIAKQVIILILSNSLTYSMLYIS